MSSPDPFPPDAQKLRKEFGAGVMAEAEYQAQMRAARDAERDMALEILTVPHPSAVAFSLPLWAARALEQACRGNDPANAGCLRLPHDISPEQRRWLALGGMVEIQGPYLTVFGSRVRKCLLREDV